MSKEFYTGDKFMDNIPTYHVEHSLWKAAQVNKMVKKNKLEIKSICDIGCGAGEVLYQLQKILSKEIIFDGYDISPGAIKLSKQRENDRLNFYLKDLLEKEVREYDLLLCLDVFEHIEDYFGFLEKVKDKANYKIFHIPLDMNVLLIIFSNELINTRNSVGHLHYFMKETAIVTLEDTGYEIIDWFYTESAFEFGDNWRTRLVNAFRKIFFLINKNLAVRFLGGFELLVLAK